MARRRPIRDENDESRSFVVCLSQYAELEVTAFDEDDAIEQAKMIAQETSSWEVDSVQEQ